MILSSSWVKMRWFLVSVVDWRQKGCDALLWGRRRANKLAWVAFVPVQDSSDAVASTGNIAFDVACRTRVIVQPVQVVEKAARPESMLQPPNLVRRYVKLVQSLWAGYEERRHAVGSGGVAWIVRRKPGGSEA